MELETYSFTAGVSVDGDSRTYSWHGTEARALDAARRYARQYGLGWVRPTAGGLVVWVRPDGSVARVSDSDGVSRPSTATN